MLCGFFCLRPVSCVPNVANFPVSLYSLLLLRFYLTFIYM